jgi:hypothetical protein
LLLRSYAAYPAMNSSYPARWFYNVRKFTVGYEADFLWRRHLTVVRIYYDSWWRFRRTVCFVHGGEKVRPSTTHDRHPEAQVLVEKLKEATGCSSSSTDKSYRI